MAIDPPTLINNYKGDFKNYVRRCSDAIYNELKRRAGIIDISGHVGINADTLFNSVHSPFFKDDNGIIMDRVCEMIKEEYESAGWRVTISVEDKKRILIFEYYK